MQDLIEPKIITIDESLSHNQILQLKLTAQTYGTFWNTGQKEYALKALHKNFKDLNLPPGRTQGLQGPLDAAMHFRKIVPNLKCSIEEMIIIKDKVICKLHFKGNFLGTLENKKGKGQKIDFEAVDMYTIKNGKIITNWHLEDNAKFADQIS